MHLTGLLPLSYVQPAFSSSSSLKIVFMCRGVLSGCLSVHYSMLGVHRDQKRVSDSLGLVIDDCEMTCRF